MVIVIKILVVTIVGNYYQSTTALSGKVIPSFIYIIGVYLIGCGEISIYEL